MSFLYKIGQLVAVKSEKLGNFYGTIINTEPDGKFRNYLIVVTHPTDSGMAPGNQAWVDEIRIIGEATKNDAEAHTTLVE